MPRQLIIVVLGSFLVGALAGLGLLLTASPGPPFVETSGTALIGGPFTLIDQNGKIVFQHDGEGQYDQIDRTVARLLNASSSFLASPIARTSVPLSCR